jgi:hypothetical protein
VLRIQQSLDQVTSMIYARVGIGLGESYSATLLIHPEGEDSGKKLPPSEESFASVTETNDAALTHEPSVVLPPAIPAAQPTQTDAVVIHPELPGSEDKAKPIPA